VGRHEYDPDVGHVYKPNVEQILQTREWRQVWRSNSEGLRADRDYGERKPGTYRILVVGDSFTVGDQVALADTYPGVLERRLGERLGPGRVEVLNAGFPSYGTVHAARWLQKFGVRFQPDLVVLGMTPNDLVERNPLSVIARDGAMVRANSSERELRRWQELQRWYNVRGIVDRSAVARRLNEAMAAFDEPGRYTHYRAFLAVPDEAAAEQYAFAERQVLDIYATTQSIGADLFILTIPFREQLAPMEQGLDPTRFGRVWRAFADRYDIPSVDLLDDFRRHPDPNSLFWTVDSHCTQAGYELIGQVLAEAIWQHRQRVRLPDAN
jgi:lysophospholipase L1-like esterase